VNDDNGKAVGDDGDGKGCSAVGVLSAEEVKKLGAVSDTQGDPAVTVDENSKAVAQQNYSEADTQAFLEAVYAQSIAGQLKGLLNIFHNSNGGGPYDFHYNELTLSHWTRCGRTMDASQFANYVAGFQGAAYDSTYTLQPDVAQPLVEGFGVLYHVSGATVAHNDPLDKTGMPDIKAGERAGRAFVSGFRSLSCQMEVRGN